MPLSNTKNSILTSYLRNRPKAAAPKSIGVGFGGQLPTSLGANLPAPTYSANAASATFNPAATNTAAPTIGAGGGPAGGASTSDPRDPTYWSDVAKIGNYYKDTMADYQHQQDLGQRTLQDTLTQLAKQQPIDITGARQNFNKSGLFYSTALSNAQADIGEKYNKANTDANRGYQDLIDNLTTMRGRLNRDYGTGPNGELTGTQYTDALNAAIGRQTDRDTAAAQAQLLASLANGGGDSGSGVPIPQQPGSMQNGKFVSTILPSQTTALINQWIANANSKPKATSSKPQKTTGR